MIPFNKPYLSGDELVYIQDAVGRGHLSGNGYYTKKCHSFFSERFSFDRCLLTTSCTDALEMCALLLEIKEGDEIIMPTYTFVSTANAFALRGAKIIFVDSQKDSPNMDHTAIAGLITAQTKAIVVVHYAGYANDMDYIMNLANQHQIYVVEDAAQAIDSYYKDRLLGSIGHVSTFSFHETKNIQCGEGGLLVVNDEKLFQKAEIIWEKGTNRTAFYRGEVAKYTWLELGSSFLPSELNAAYLYAQLLALDDIQQQRKRIWSQYYEGLISKKQTAHLVHSNLKEYQSKGANFHMFYMLTESLSERNELLAFLNKNKILALFHYVPLHSSAYFQAKYNGAVLKNAEIFANQLVRLPLYPELSAEECNRIINAIGEFYE